jgi:methionyl-tRNA formyltransferase
MGTPEFAVPALRSLAARDDIDLITVVTQPDRPAGRGKKLAPPPVKEAALALGVPVLQTDSLRHADVKQEIIESRPDLIIVAAFGMILGKWILELPTHGCVNLHASLLPKHRGASPISAAILAGDEVTGVTLMQMDRGLDTGDMLATNEVAIERDDTTESLTPKLADAAATLMDLHLADLLTGQITAVPQPEGATETRQLTKEDGRIDWNMPAAIIERQVRAMWNWPRAFAELPGGTRMQVHRAVISTESPANPGQISVQGTNVVVGTGEGGLLLERVQLPGGKPIEGHAIVQALQRYS